MARGAVTGRKGKGKGKGKANNIVVTAVEKEDTVVSEEVITTSKNTTKKRKTVVEVETQEVEKEQVVEDEISSDEGEKDEVELESDVEEDDFNQDDRIFLKSQAEAEDDGRGVVYVGRIPHGFYEKEMRAFFEQFGPVTRLRISRNKKTGKSKHYGFVEFEDEEVAKIVAKTMDGHLMFNHILRVKVMDRSKIHPRLFVGANKTYKVAPTHKVQRSVHNRVRDPRDHSKLTRRLLRSDTKKRSKLEKMGIDYDYPGYKACVPAKPKKTKFSD